MLKKSISEDKFKVLEKYIKLNKQLKSIEKERKELLKSFFEGEPKKETTANIAIRGTGTAFMVERQEKPMVSWKGIAQSEIKENRIAKILPEFSGTYNQYLVKV